MAEKIFFFLEYIAIMVIFDAMFVRGKCFKTSRKSL